MKKSAPIRWLPPRGANSLAPTDSGIGSIRPLCTGPPPSSDSTIPTCCIHRNPPTPEPAPSRSRFKRRKLHPQESTGRVHPVAALPDPLRRHDPETSLEFATERSCPGKSQLFRHFPRRDACTQPLPCQAHPLLPQPHLRGQPGVPVEDPPEITLAALQIVTKLTHAKSAAPRQVHQTTTAFQALAMNSPAALRPFDLHTTPTCNPPLS